jgi:hypothetical protein
MKSVLSIILLLSVTTILRAQEVQVPFDSAGRIEVITSDMEDKLQLFPEYPNFQEARLFQKKDNSYFLEIRYTEVGKLTRVQLKETPEEVAVLQKKVTEGLHEKVPESFVDQSSRSKFLVWETLLSTFAYSGLLISSFDMNAEAATGTVLVVGGLGFYIPYLLTNNGSMSDAEASLALGGAFTGFFHGSLLETLITNGHSGSEYGVVLTLTSVAETYAGFQIAHSTGMSEGKADVIRYMGLFGIMQGAALGAVIQLDASASYYAAFALVGSAGGYIVGTALANSEPYTRGNASVLGTAGLFGAYVVAAPVASALSYGDGGEGPARGVLVSGMLGNAGGLYLGNTLMKGKHFSTAEGNYVILSTTAGWLVGAGLGMLITSGSTQGSPWALTIPTVLGSAAGFGIMVSSLGKGSGSSHNTGWNVNFNPGALMGVLLPQRHHTTNANAYVPPALGVSYRW